MELLVENGRIQLRPSDGRLLVFAQRRRASGMMRRSRVGGGHHPQSEGGAPSKGHRNLKSIHDGMVETVVEPIVGGAAHGAGAVARAFGHKLPHWTHHGSVGYERDHELELDIESRVAPMRMADVLQCTQQKKEKEQEDYTSSMAPPPADKPSKSVSFAEAGAPRGGRIAPAPSSSSALSKKTKPDCLKFIGRNVLKPTKEQEGSGGGMVKAVTAALDGQPVPYIIHFHKGGMSHTRRSLRDVVRRWQEQMDENRKTSSTHGGGSAAGGGGGGGGVSRRNSTSAHSTLQRSSWLFGSSNNLQVPADFGGSMREMSELSGAPGIHQQKSDGSRPTTLTLWVGTWNAGEKRLDADQVSDEALREWLRIPKPGWVLQGDQEEPRALVQRRKRRAALISRSARRQVEGSRIAQAVQIARSRQSAQFKDVPQPTGSQPRMLKRALLQVCFLAACGGSLVRQRRRLPSPRRLLLRRLSICCLRRLRCILGRRSVPWMRSVRTRCVMSM